MAVKGKKKMTKTSSKAAPKKVAAKAPSRAKKASEKKAVEPEIVESTTAMKTAKAKAPTTLAPKKVKAEIVHAPTSRAAEPEEAPSAEEIHGFQEEGLAEGPTFSDIDIHVDPEDAKLPVPVEADGRAVSTTDPVATYLAEIRRYPLLTREEERALAVRYRETGDAKAAERLVTSNLRFVVKIATEYSKFGAKLIDLIQEGNVGLMHAVREFNPYKDVRLITYAVWWIRGYIQEFLMRQYSMVRIGTTQTQRKLFYRLQKEKDRLDRMGEDPTNIPLLASSLGVDEEDVRQMSQRLSGRDVSLNQPLDSDSPTSLLDMEASNEPDVSERLGHAEELEVLRENIEKIRGGLNEKELYILENRILADEPMTLQEIGEHYGVTREAVRQLEARLIGRIRNAFNASVENHAEIDDE